MIKIKDKIRKVVNRSIRVLSEVRDILEEPQVSTDKDWSVYIINTDTHFAVVAARDGFTEMIPEDGSFISGICISSGLTEKAARLKITELGKSLGEDEDASEPDEDLS